MAKKFSQSFYHSKQWKEVRSYILTRDNYLCCRCGKPATEVHHIIHLTEANIGDTAITLNADNLISLCAECHKEQHYNDRYHREYYFDENGYLQRIPTPQAESLDFLAALPRITPAPTPKNRYMGIKAPQAERLLYLDRIFYRGGGMILRALGALSAF